MIAALAGFAHILAGGAIGAIGGSIIALSVLHLAAIYIVPAVFVGFLAGMASRYVLECAGPISLKVGSSASGGWDRGGRYEKGKTDRSKLSSEETVKINEMIAEAEKTTAGEIKLLVVQKSTWMGLSSLKMRIAAARKRAKREFIELGLQHARKGTGILIMISLKERVVVVESGKALEGRLSQNIWERLRDMIINGISSGKRMEGICSAIREAGRILTEHFPAGPDDTNEISNRIVFKG